MRIRATHDEVAKEYQDDILKQLEDVKKRYEILEWKYEQLKAKQGEEVNS